jgi:hypothetical protein
MTLEFKTYELKSSWVVAQLVLNGIFGVLAIMAWTEWPPKNFGLSIAITLPLLTGIILRTVALLTSKVTFDEMGVSKHSVFGRPWGIRCCNLRTFGVVSDNKLVVVDPDLIDENTLEYFQIFLSKSPEFDLYEKKRQFNLRLQYRKDVYEQIRAWVRTSAHNCLLVSRDLQFEKEIW